MNFFTGLYNQKLADNEKNIRFWEEYLNNLKALDFSLFANKLKVPALIPIGSRLLFRGELKHTNEVTVALGADYFVKCSVQQAEVLKQHRIKGAQSKLDIFLKEKEFLENQFSLGTDVIHEKQGQDIVEFHTEEEDRAWREKHRENVRIEKHKQSKTETKTFKDNDDSLWERLEELEIQEELENEFLSMKENKLENKHSASIFSEAFIEVFSEGKHTESDTIRGKALKENAITEDAITENAVTFSENKLTDSDDKITNSAIKVIKSVNQDTSMQAATKSDLLQKVIDKQNELGDRLQELKNKDWGQSKTEKDLIRKLDEMEQLDELEDEMERLEDLIEEEDDDNKTNENPVLSLPPPKTNANRRVSFADDHESDTLELHFKHSDTESNKDPYDNKKGLQKPSDVYDAFPHLFNDTISILKKKNYYSDKEITKHVPNTVIFEDTTLEGGGGAGIEDSVASKTIVIRDVVERSVDKENVLTSTARPTSLFKMRRQQKE